MILSFVSAVLIGASSAGGTPSKLPLLAVGRLQAIKVDSSEVEVLQESMTSALIGTRRVRVMERAQVDRILSEQGFQESGTCDVASCAVKAGQLLGVDRIVVGSVGRVGRTTTLNLRSVDVASGEVLGSSTRTVQGDLEAVIGILPQAASELVATSPTPSGPVVASNPSAVAVGGYFGMRYTAPGPPGVQAVRILQGVVDTGVAITVVAKGSPAEAAGMREGDVVLAKDGVPVVGVERFKAQLSSVAPGETVLFKVRRDRGLLEIRVKASTRP